VVAKEETFWIDGKLVDRRKGVRNVILKLMKRKICIVINAMIRPYRGHNKNVFGRIMCCDGWQSPMAVILMMMLEGSSDISRHLSHGALRRRRRDMMPTFYLDNSAHTTRSSVLRLINGEFVVQKHERYAGHHMFSSTASEVIIGRDRWDAMRVEMHRNSLIH
jgi:hypothetical protein